MRNTTAYTNKSTLAKDRVIGVNIQLPHAKILDIFFISSIFVTFVYLKSVS